jgi:peptidoglycan/xylan/chitin deacetylase (PgdA/CDA1 family)
MLVSIIDRARTAAASSLRETAVSKVIVGAKNQLENVQSLFTASRLRSRRCGPGVLLYHGVVPKVSDPFVEGAHIEAELFRTQIRHLRRHYRVVSLAKIVDRLKSDQPLPNDWVALTFDDGYRNNLHCARQILHEEGDLPMSVFVITDFMGGNYTHPTVMIKMLLLHLRASRFRVPLMDGSWANRVMSSRRRRANVFWEVHRTLRALSPDEQQEALSVFVDQLGDGEADEIRARFSSFDWLDWDEIRELRADGVEIGSHTRTHPAMRAELGAERLQAEIEASRDRISTEVGVAPRSFAYPYGSKADVSDLAIRLLGEAGYQCALTTIPGTVQGESRVFELPRLAGCVQSMGQFRRANASGMES